MSTPDDEQAEALFEEWLEKEEQLRLEPQEETNE